MRSEAFQSEEELKWEHPAPEIRRQMMGYNGQLIMVKMEFEKGAIGTLHEHYHTQATCMASGKFELTIDNRKEILSTDDGYHVVPDKLHGCIYLETRILIGTFNPMRADFLEQFLMNGRLSDNDGTDLSYIWHFLSTKTALSLRYLKTKKIKNRYIWKRLQGN